MSEPSRRPDYCAELPVLERAAGIKASSLQIDSELAAIAYAICGIDPGSLTAHLRLGHVLATLGDLDGATEVFVLAGQVAETATQRRTVVERFQDAKERAGRAWGKNRCTLASLRASGSSGVDNAVALARSVVARPRKCSKCDGRGYIWRFREHAQGVCYDCAGSGYEAG